MLGRKYASGIRAFIYEGSFGSCEIKIQINQICYDEQITLIFNFLGSLLIKELKNMNNESVERKQNSNSASQPVGETPGHQPTAVSPHGEVGRLSLCQGGFVARAGYTFNHDSDAGVLSVANNESPNQSGANAMDQVAHCLDNQNFELSLKDIIMSTTKLSSAERTETVPYSVNNNTTQINEDICITHSNSKMTQRGVTGAIMRNTQNTPAVGTAVGVISKLKDHQSKINVWFDKTRYTGDSEFG